MLDGGAGQPKKLKMIIVYNFFLVVCRLFQLFKMTVVPELALVAVLSIIISLRPGEGFTLLKPISIHHNFIKREIIEDFRCSSILKCSRISNVQGSEMFRDFKCKFLVQADDP